MPEPIVNNPAANDPKPGTSDPQGDPKPTETKTWDEVLKGLPEDQQKLYNEHTIALNNTIKATRDERDEARNLLREALKKAETGSEAEKSLQEALGRIDLLDKRANFAEQAIKPEIGCRNVRAAFALAQASDLFKKNGVPDCDAIKKEAPELFGPLIPEGNGGSGTDGDQTAPVDMNQWIRDRAGIKST